MSAYEKLRVTTLDRSTYGEGMQLVKFSSPCHNIVTWNWFITFNAVLSNVVNHPAHLNV